MPELAAIIKPFQEKSVGRALAPDRELRAGWEGSRRNPQAGIW